MCSLTQGFVDYMSYCLEAGKTGVMIMIITFCTNGLTHMAIDMRLWFKMSSFSSSK